MRKMWINVWLWLFCLKITCSNDIILFIKRAHKYSTFYKGGYVDFIDFYQLIDFRRRSSISSTYCKIVDLRRLVCYHRLNDFRRLLVFVSIFVNPSNFVGSSSFLRFVDFLNMLICVASSIFINFRWFVNFHRLFNLRLFIDFCQFLPII